MFLEFFIFLWDNIFIFLLNFWHITHVLMLHTCSLKQQWFFSRVQWFSMTRVVSLLSSLYLGFTKSVVQSRIVRIWELFNLNNENELFLVDMLQLDEQVNIAIIFGFILVSFCYGCFIIFILLFIFDRLFYVVNVRGHVFMDISKNTWLTKWRHNLPMVHRCPSNVSM